MHDLEFDNVQSVASSVFSREGAFPASVAK